MRNFVFVLIAVLVPTVVMAQGIKVTSVYGPVEVTPASGSALVQVTTGSADVLGELSIGDEVRTGPSAQMTLELQDGSYIVISENTTLKIEEYWGSSVRNLMRVMLGKVRFHIQKLGGRPNPYRVNTPTALIAVKGTEFVVTVDDTSDRTEVWTYEGRVTVKSSEDSDREVILDAGRKTLVRAGEHPMMPVGLDQEFRSLRTLEVVRKDGETGGEAPSATGSLPNPGAIANDNDRRSRTIDPLPNPNTNRPGTSVPVRRGKLSFPR
jgi:hypothetical protein